MTSINRGRLTVAMRIEDRDQADAFLSDLFARMGEYPTSRDGVAVYAFAWGDVFEERDALETRVEQLEEDL